MFPQTYAPRVNPVLLSATAAVVDGLLEQALRPRVAPKAETKAERSARLNRERCRRYRESKRAGKSQTVAA